MFCRIVMPLTSGSNSPGRLGAFDPEDKGMKAVEPLKFKELLTQ
jgi:hypothetical protein